MTPEWAEALHGRRAVLEREIEERRRELAAIGRALVQAVERSTWASRKREREVRQGLHPAKHNPPPRAYPAEKD